MFLRGGAEIQEIWHWKAPGQDMVDISNRSTIRKYQKVVPSEVVPKSRDLTPETLRPEILHAMRTREFLMECVNGEI